MAVGSSFGGRVRRWAHLGASGVVALSLAYHVLAIFEVVAFVRHCRRVRPGGFGPTVTVLKPVAAWDRRVYDNLLTFCRQDYPAFQLVIGVKASDTTAGLEPPPDFTACSPGCTAELVVCEKELAVNPKVSQLIRLEGRAWGAVVIVSDDDIRVEPDYLARVVLPFQDPTVGAVTCLYVSRTAPTLAAAVEALAVNVDFAPAVLVARRLFGVKFALGASLAVRREILAAVGGFRAVGDYLADDYQLGRQVLARGFRLALAPYIVENTLPPMDLVFLFRHQLRWSRTNRVCQPVGWFFSVITQLFAWTLVLAALRGLDGRGRAVLSGVVAFRLAGAYVINRELGGLRPFWKYVWLIPLKDLFSTAMWALSFTGRRVHWAGRDYVVSADGRLRPATGRKAVPPAR